MNRYIKVENDPFDQTGFKLLVLPVNISKPKAISEFYSQLFALFGGPNIKRYEGYSYLIQDTQTGTFFSAELNQFGQGYSGKEESLEVIREFDQFSKGKRW